MRQEDLVDSVTVDAIIYNPGGSHLGAFPGPLLSANHHPYMEAQKIANKISNTTADAVRHTAAWKKKHRKR